MYGRTCYVFVAQMAVVCVNINMYSIKRTAHSVTTSTLKRTNIERVIIEKWSTAIYSLIAMITFIASREMTYEPTNVYACCNFHLIDPCPSVRLAGEHEINQSVIIFYPTMD